MKKHDYTAKNTMVEYMVSGNEYGQKFRTAGHWGGGTNGKAGASLPVMDTARHILVHLVQRRSPSLWQYLRSSFNS